MKMDKAVLTCDKLTVYSPDYRMKIIKRGEEGVVLDNGSVKVFCVTHEGITFSYKVEKNDFKYTSEKNECKNIDVIKKYVFGNIGKDKLYTLLLSMFFKNSIGICSKDMRAKIIHCICTSDYYKSDLLPIPCNEYDFYELVEEWYINNEEENEEELLTKILQVILFDCNINDININKLFV